MDRLPSPVFLGFPGGSDSNKSAYDVGDLRPITGLGGSPRGGHDNRAPLVVQIVNNLSAIQETWVQSLGQESLLEKGMSTHSSILAWRIPWTEEA